jgi:hypothetical protein
LFLTAATDGESSSRPGRFAPGIHWIGGWVGPTGGLDAVEKILFLPYTDSNSDSSVVKPIARRYSESAVSFSPDINMNHNDN